MKKLIITILKVIAIKTQNTNQKGKSKVESLWFNY